MSDAQLLLLSLLAAMVLTLVGSVLLDELRDAWRRR